MKVRIQVDPAISEEYAEFHVREITDEVSRFAEIIEKSNSVITGADEFERTIIIERCQSGRAEAKRRNMPQKRLFHKKDRFSLRFQESLSVSWRNQLSDKPDSDDAEALAVVGYNPNSTCC